MIAAKEAGAGCIIVTGLSRDERKLELAREFGADHTIDIERENAVVRVREITSGLMASVTSIGTFFTPLGNGVAESPSSVGRAPAPPL